jgi:drug/metabolite transporter (DMT)-like permease
MPNAENQSQQGLSTITDQAKKTRLVGYGLLVITMIIWGSFTLISRVGTTQVMTTWDIGALRFMTASIVLIPIQIYRREWRFLFDLRVLGLALIGGIAYTSFVYEGFHHAPAAHAAIWMNGLLPFWTAIAALVILRESLSRDNWISLIIIAIGLIGMSSLMFEEQRFTLGIGDLFFVLASMSWGIYTALLKRWMLPPWQAMAGVALLSTVMYIPIYLLFLPSRLAEASVSQILIQAVFQGILVVIIAMLTFIGAVERLGAVKVGSILALAPLLAALAAVPLLGESLSLAVLIGLIAVSIGALQPWRLLR